MSVSTSALHPTAVSASIPVFLCLPTGLIKAHVSFVTDKAGGKKFSKDFEEGSAQLHEFIKILNNHCKTGPPLMQILNNADIFYETQYKEVKIVANVSHKMRRMQFGEVLCDMSV